MHHLYALEDQHEGLNPFWVTLLKQVVLVLPLQQAHSQDVECALKIHEGVDLLSMQNCTGAVKHIQEILDVVVELQNTLHKLMNSYLVGLLEEI